METHKTLIAEVLQAAGDDFLQQWLGEGLQGAGSPGLTRPADAQALLDALRQGVQAGGDPSALTTGTWSALREVLGSISSSRAAQGGSASDTSRFVLALKKPLFDGLRQRVADVQELMDAVFWASTLVDAMVQFTVGAYQRTREEIIQRQQHELLELSTPVIKLWEGVLAVPMIGTLDSNRTQLVMEALLERIVDSGSELAIIDITGVPTVDTLVAQHLMKTVAAIRLMGADCIISGIRPQIAQTIIQLGIDLRGIITKASLADALALALKRSGYVVTRAAA